MKNQSIQSLEKKNYHFWAALFRSFFSPHAYIDVAKNWKGLNAGYLFLILMLATAPFCLRLEYTLYQFFDEHVTFPLQNMPKIDIRNGEIEFEHFMPYQLKNPSGKTILIIDTTDKVKTIDHNINPDLTWLFTKNTIYFKLPPLTLLPHVVLTSKNGEWNETFENDENAIIDGREIASSTTFKVIFYSILLFIYPCIVCFLWSIIFFLTLAVTWAMQFYIRVIFQMHASFKTVCRLLIYAFTPILFIFFIPAAFHHLLLPYRIQYFILFTLYFNLGILAVRRYQKQLVHF